MIRSHTRRSIINVAILAILAGLLLGVMVPAALASEMVPLKGRFDGVGNDFSGNFTHLGRFEGVLDPATFTAVWTAANGDTVTNQTISFVLLEEVAPGVYRYEQALLITGGSGRFTGAAGSATVTGLYNLVTGAYDGILDGTISQPNSGG